MAFLFRIKKKRERGHSLPELLVAVALLVIVGMGAVLYSITLQTDIKKTMASANSLNHARVATEYLKRDIISAKKIVASIGSYTTGNDEIILALYPQDASGNIHICEDCETDATHFDYIIYRLVSDGTVFDLERIVSPNSAGYATKRNISSQEIALNVTNSVLFTCNGTNLASVADLSTVDNLTLTLTVSTGIHMDRVLTQTLSTQAYFRNYSN